LESKHICTFNYPPVYSFCLARSHNLQYCTYSRAPVCPPPTPACPPPYLLVPLPPPSPLFTLPSFHINFPCQIHVTLHWRMWTPTGSLEGSAKTLQIIRAKISPAALSRMTLRRWSWSVEEEKERSAAGWSYPSSNQYHDDLRMNWNMSSSWESRHRCVQQELMLDGRDRLPISGHWSGSP
jgi:hypothetical protein